MKFKHGQRVTCEIKGTKITDAKISINNYGTPFICQNIMDGGSTDNKLGYMYSWALYGDFTNTNVKNLHPAVKSFDYPEVGDVYVDKDGDRRTVLGVCGRVIHLSLFGDENTYGIGFTKEELIEHGYTIEQDKEEVEELTMEEVCKELGRTVKIKK